jgi:hypothetical protein
MNALPAVDYESHADPCFDAGRAGILHAALLQSNDGVLRSVSGLGPLTDFCFILHQRGLANV